MSEKKNMSNTKEADAERSTEEIRQDIANGEENISRTVGQIGDRIKEKLDWREYVKDSPYWAAGAAAGLGLLVSGMFIRKSTPLERIMDSIAGEIRSSLGGRIAGAEGTGLMKLTLQAIAVKAATDWIKRTIPANAAGTGSGTRPVKGRTSAINPKADMSKNINS